MKSKDELTEKDWERIKNDQMKRLEKLRTMGRGIFEKFDKRQEERERAKEADYQRRLAEYKAFKGSSLDWMPPPPKRRQK